MVSIKVFCRFVLVIFVCMIFTSCKGGEQKTSAKSDTAILAAYDHPFTISADTPYCQLSLVSSGNNLSGGKKIILFFDEPKVRQAPDGVYEVYITTGKNDIKSFSYSHPGFVNVLDIYELTAIDPPKHLSLDLTKISNQWEKDGLSLPNLFVTILFRGNKKVNNVESKLAGMLEVQRLRIIEQ